MVPTRPFSLLPLGKLCRAFASFGCAFSGRRSLRQPRSRVSLPETRACLAATISSHAPLRARGSARDLSRKEGGDPPVVSQEVRSLDHGRVEKRPSRESSIHSARQRSTYGPDLSRGFKPYIMFLFSQRVFSRACCCCLDAAQWK